MLQTICWFLILAARCLLSLRYRVRVVGTETVLQKPGPYLILPSHPAYIDPPNAIAHLLMQFRMWAMLLETNFKSPVLALLAWFLRTIYIPATEKECSCQ